MQPNGDRWEAEVDRVRRLLGAPHNPTLLPPHFVKATLPRIGGHVVVAQRGSRILGVGFLLPRRVEAGRRIYTLRYHRLGSLGEASPSELVAQVEQLLAGDRAEFYDPTEPQTYRSELLAGHRADDLYLARPGEADARAIRALQAAVWQGEPDTLYPVDIHSVGFGSVQSLVAHSGDRMLGFLFGFYAFSGWPLPSALWVQSPGFRLESQVLAVSPDARHHGVATALKLGQAQLARQLGIDVVHWTFDPLQFANAALNVGRLRAVAAVHLPGYYPFVNVLNRVTASRLGVTWTIASRRVAPALRADAKAHVLDLRDDPSVVRVNDGPEARRLDADADAIAVEIPPRWTELQAEAPGLALRWREATDRLFARYLGWTADRYVLTDVGVDGERRYLVARRADDALLAQLASTDGVDAA
ncbi:MAG: GNAT family N-acetyltransferase [Anaerolineae bacterium]|nr:GNAT family N-acetyltransferase [Anaerolineae bacterium]